MVESQAGQQELTPDGSVPTHADDGITAQGMPSSPSPCSQFLITRDRGDRNNELLPGSAVADGLCFDLQPPRRFPFVPFDSLFPFLFHLDTLHGYM